MNGTKQPKRIASLQMVSGADVASNLAAATKLLKQAAAEGARLAVLPENFAFMGKSERDVLGVRELESAGPIQDFLAEQAQRHGLWIVAGTIPLLCDKEDKHRAACLLYDDTGLPVARYDKIHLFDVTVQSGTEEQYRESNTIDGGNEVVVVDTPVGRLGLAICYDLRFPELFRALARRGTEIIALPAAFTAVTGAAHWHTLLRARAIENLCYLVSSAQGGRHPSDRETYGHSMIVDPWGVVLGELQAGQGLICTELDREQLAATRRAFPALDHIRLDIP